MQLVNKGCVNRIEAKSTPFHNLIKFEFQTSKKGCLPDEFAIFRCAAGTVILHRRVASLQWVRMMNGPRPYLSPVSILFPFSLTFRLRPPQAKVERQGNPTFNRFSAGNSGQAAYPVNIVVYCIAKYFIGICYKNVFHILAFFVNQNSNYDSALQLFFNRLARIPDHSPERIHIGWTRFLLHKDK